MHDQASLTGAWHDVMTTVMTMMIVMMTAVMTMMATMMTMTTAVMTMMATMTDDDYG